MIETVKLLESDGEHNGYIMNGTWNVPLSEGNRHYHMIQEWIAEGNTPAPMYTQEELDEQQASQDEREALEESIRNKLKALGLTTKEMGLLGIPEEECN